MRRMQHGRDPFPPQNAPTKNISVALRPEAGHAPENSWLFKGDSNFSPCRECDHDSSIAQTVT